MYLMRGLWEIYLNVVNMRTLNNGSAKRTGVLKINQDLLMMSCIGMLLCKVSYLMEGPATLTLS